MPKRITHELKLQGTHEPLAAFLAQCVCLAEKRGPILVQLPPSLSFDAAVVVPFLGLLRRVYRGPVVCEPRHATWFSPEVDNTANGAAIENACELRPTGGGQLMHRHIQSVPTEALRVAQRDPLEPPPAWYASCFIHARP